MDRKGLTFVEAEARVIRKMADERAKDDRIMQLENALREIAGRAFTAALDAREMQNIARAALQDTKEPA